MSGGLLIDFLMVVDDAIRFVAAHTVASTERVSKDGILSVAEKNERSKYQKRTQY